MPVFLVVNGKSYTSGYMIINKSFLLVLALLGLAPQMQAIDYQVVPLPKDIQMKGGDPFVLDASCVIVCNDEDTQMQHNASFLQDYIMQATGLRLQIVDKAPRKTKALRLAVSREITGKEAYRLTVSPKQGVLLEGGSPQGVFYAVQTLRKSIGTGAGDIVELPAAVVTDEPRFAYRAMHLDVCRHFFPVEMVKEYIDILALHNMNTFHWHLTDDQGWRIESKKYPRLHEVGSQRRHTVIGRNIGIYDEIPHGGYYTQEQLREVVAYAQQRCITVIPEVELPGHALAILAAYPELGCTGGPYEVEPTWGVFDDILCAGNDKAFDLLCGVIDEIAQIFPSKYINIGGDEAPKNRWKACPKCQQRIREEGIKADGDLSAEAKLQGYFTNRMERHINAIGRSIIGWDEIMEGDISQSATILCWRGVEAGLKAAEQGHDVIMAPTSYCYFDYYQLDEEKEWSKPLLIGGYVPLEKVYSFEPIPETLSGSASSHIIGVQANIWTEYIPYRSLLLYQMLPRAAALSEIQWVRPDQKDYGKFADRERRLLPIYEQQGYEYCRKAITL